MAKQLYKIPTPMSLSFMQHQISLSGGGFQTKPIPIAVILFYLCGLLLTVWSVMATFIRDSGFLPITAYVIWCVFAVVYFGRYSKTKELKIQQVPAMMAYAPKSARHVSTRRSSKPDGMYSILGIDAIEENGTVRFADKTVGQAYRVVGSASILLFDEDRRAILDRVDAFWRKINESCEYIFLTAKEPQRIHRQLANLQRQYDGLKVRDPQLEALMEEKRSILVDYVGDRFKSIHQYLVLKADNEESLRTAQSVLQSEVEGTGLMIKQCTRLNGPDTIDMLSTIYRGRE